MTFELDDSRPHRLITKAMLGHVHLWIEKREKQKDGPLFEPDVLGHELAKGIGANEKAVFLPYDDFLRLVYYVLTCEDLRPNDPRLAFIEEIKKSKIVPGWNTSFGDEKSRRISVADF